MTECHFVSEVFAQEAKYAERIHLHKVKEMGELLQDVTPARGPAKAAGTGSFPPHRYLEDCRYLESCRIQQRIFPNQ